MVQIYSSERYLAYLYSIGAFASLLCTICMAVVWLHWRVVLNTCAGNFQSYASYYDEKDCGCILYARDTLTYFVGSDIGLWWEKLIHKNMTHLTTFNMFQATGRHLAWSFRSSFASSSVVTMSIESAASLPANRDAPKWNFINDHARPFRWTSSKNLKLKTMCRHTFGLQLQSSPLSWFCTRLCIRSCSLMDSSRHASNIATESSSTS